MKHVSRRIAIPLVLALALAGCGDDNDTSGTPSSSSTMGSMPGMDQSSQTPTPAADHNDADAAFATGMIPHHGQAVTMSDLALKKATSAEVKRLATAIKAAQSPEITTMSGWLTAWGLPVPDPAMAGTGHDMPTTGMMSEQEMKDLSAAGGAAFDRMWVQLMIKHHQGAVTMARTEQTGGQYQAAIALAKQIETGQTKEITSMQGLLKTLGG